MRLTILIACYSCVFLGACSGETSSKSAANSNSTDKTKISFGVYDIASSGPNFSSFFAPPAPLLQKGVSISPSDQINKPAPAGDVEKATLAQTEVANPNYDQCKVVKNAEMRLEDADPDTLQKVIVGIAEANSGFVLSIDQSMSDEALGKRDTVTIAIRVPADRFTTAVDSIRQEADRFIVEAVKGEDVTEEFIDIQARLRAKRELETQFLQILKRAETVEDALSVQNQLANVRTDVEKIEGRLRFLENQSAFSTIKVSIQTPSSIAAQSVGFFGRLGDSASRGVDAAGNFTLGLVTFLIGAFPLALFVGLPIFLIGRSLWPRNTITMSITEAAKEEIKTE